MRCAALWALAAAAVLALCAAGAVAQKGPVAQPAPAGPSPLAVDLGLAQEVAPNASVTGTVGGQAPRYYKVFANRSLSAPETLAVTLEATGSLFGAGSLSLFDPEQVLLDEVFTFNGGDLVVSRIIVPETGYYLLTVSSDGSYPYAVTVNWTSGGAFPSDSDNDLGNATVLTGNGSTVNGSVTDWSDLVDLYAVDLAVAGGRSDALLVNLTSPNIADIDVYLYHIVAGVAEIDGLSISPTGTEYAAALPPATGRFYLRVMSYSGSSPYALEWSRLSVVADDNRVPSTATPLAAGSSLNNLSRWDLRDLFVVTLAANTTVNVSLHTVGFNSTTRTPDLQAVFWNATFGRVSWSFSFDPDERINAEVPDAGVYYLDIFAADPVWYLSTNLSFDYTMSVSIDAPPALSSPSWNATFYEDEPAAVDLLAAVPPDPLGEVLSFSLVGMSANVTAAVAADGHTIVVTTPADWSGSAVVWVAATDRFHTVVVALPITVVAVNDPPRLALGAGALAFDEDTTGLLNLSSAVFDPEGDAWSLLGTSASLLLSVQGAGAVLTLSSPADYYGAVALVLAVEDARGAAANLSVAVSVRPVNDPPRFTGVPGPFVLWEDSSAATAVFQVSGVAFDPDDDPVRFLLLAPAPISVFWGLNQTLALYPARDFAGNLTATLVATDGNASSSVEVLISVLPLDDAPWLTVPAGQRLAKEGEEFRFDAEGSDIDTPLSSLTYTFSLDGAALGALQPNRSFVHAFGFEDAGFHVLRVTVSDGNQTSAADIRVFVSDTNRAPTALILTPRDTVFAPGALVSFSSRAVDPDGTAVNLTWIIDGTARSTSPSFSIDRMSPGRHIVELHVFDGEFTDIDAAAFEVQQGLPSPGAAGALAALLFVAFAPTAARRLQPPSINSPKRLK